MIGQAHAQVAHPDKLFIGGRWIPVEGSGRFTVTNPATEEVFGEVVAAGIPEVERAVAAARKAFDEGPWPRMSAAERATYMRALSQALQRRGAALDSAWISQVV